MVCLLEELPLDPGLLVESADGGHDGQEEQAEHEIGGRAQPLVQEVAHTSFLQLTRVLTASMTGLVNRAMRTV